MNEVESDKLAVVLLAMGGPNDPDDVGKYLVNIFSDKSIIRLPGGAVGQYLLARLIAWRRRNEVAAHYRLIGGGSPLLKWTTIQAEQIERRLQIKYPGTKTFIGMRYFRPTIQSAIEQAYGEGFRKICLLSMYPQYSRATTGSSFAVARDILSKLPEVESLFIDDFHTDAGYVSLLSEYIQRYIGPNDTLLFSAHSLPKSFVEDGDPYVDQIRRTASLAAGERPFCLSFQSRTGPVEWVGPDTVDEIKKLLRATSENIFIVPISFVCDHIETLYEIDIELKNLIAEEERSRLKRMPMFNDDSRFGDLLAGLVQREVTANGTG